MLTEVCAEIRNWFCQNEDKHFGTFEISGGSIVPPDFLSDGQYFRIVGSKFNDGVHLLGASSDLVDEAFNGAVWAMAVPPAVIALTADIQEYCNKTQTGPFVSESLAGYSYSLATDKNGAPLSWETVFSRRLSKWRKLR